MNKIPKLPDSRTKSSRVGRVSWVQCHNDDDDVLEFDALVSNAKQLGAFTSKIEQSHT